ncbi:carbonic anhydrase family protein [Legionella jamestowniensis]|uniref:(Beta)-carbonic anhydrase n=1 Tax=Legionella jamestowniensis TaxID=455 RepID=A0A0W0UG93_9GAMM|nr:carbonic anhydrase family protein [Legionella jamestowniensis]KTD06942.1 (beta)-carbonic anhydrase [Legionella jamestowniensis]SFL84758.1 carbonic anhydrase [Legionella jamestowniensis DSM 19215]
MWTLTKEQQQIITPAQAIELLKEGNKRFVNNLKINRNLLQQVNETSQGQYPFAVVLSCMDSRTPAELIFDQGLGDIFSIRIAGNILNDDILASIEFACHVVGVKLIAVIGHTQCGAIKGACEDVRLGHLTSLLEKIRPVIQHVEMPDSDQNAENNEFLYEVSRQNIKHTLQQITQQSEIVRNLLKKKQIAMIGGLYHLETGSVEFYD